MRNVYEVLREKEEAIQRIGREIRALRLTASLLTDNPDAGLVPATAPEIDTTDDGKVGTTKRISARLKRLLATPVLQADRFAS